MWRVLVVAAAGAATVFCSHSPAGAPDTRSDFVPLKPELTRVVLRSLLPLVVETYWLRGLNAVGTALSEQEHGSLARYAHVLEVLDADFREVYWVFGLAIPRNRGREEWTHGAAAIALLERGAARFPDDLRLTLLLGYSLMTFSDRHVDAARAFTRASQLPGAPRFASLLATRLYLRGDHYEDALGMATSMRDAAASDEERATFSARVRELEDERVLRVLDAAGADFKARHGRYPESLSELVAAGLAQMPADARFSQLRFDDRGRALLPDSRGRMKVFHDSFGGRDDDAPETWR